MSIADKVMTTALCRGRRVAGATPDNHVAERKPDVLHQSAHEIILKSKEE